MNHRKMLVSLTLCVALATAVFAGVPVASAEDGPGFVSPQVGTFAFDIYELSGDDIKASARSLDGLIPGPGEEPYTESHTLDSATGASGDEDWYSFTVSAEDITNKRGFLIEAATVYEDTDTYIEIYGPGLAWTPTYGPIDDEDPVSIDHNDDGDFMYHGSSLAFLPYKHGGAGTYRFRVRPYADSGGYWECAGPYTLRIKQGTLERIAGATRIETAIAISQEYVESMPPGTWDASVVLANAYNFPDALAGAELCWLDDTPLLLTYGDHLPDSVRDEIYRIGVDKVYVLGGEGAISQDVIDQIGAMSPAPTVTRVAGPDRYKTACEIALQADVDYGGSISDMAIIVNGQNFPDALAASAFSAGAGVPILLTRQGSLHPDTEATLGLLGTTDVIVVGGTGVVSTAVLDRLATVLGGSDHVYRIAGDTRYETAKEFAVWACDIEGPGVDDNGSVGTPANPSLEAALDPEAVGIASGQNFPDALAGGAMCGSADHPLLLTQAGSVSDYIFEEHEGKLPGADTDYFTDIGGKALLSSRLFGGSGAVSDGTFMEMDQFFGFSSP